MFKRFVKVADETLLTPVWKLENNQGQKVVLVGMVHVGSKEYYHQVSDMLHHFEAEGFKVHYEKIKKNSQEEIDALPKDEREGFLAARQALQNNASMKLGALLGASSQNDVLKYPTSAENVDFSEMELYRKIGYQETVKFFSSRSGNEPEMTPEQINGVMKNVFKYYHLSNKLLSLFMPRFFQEVILEARNRKALLAARDQLEKSNVVLVWGAAHLSGMRRVLEHNGFNIIEEQWLEALKFKK